MAKKDEKEARSLFEGFEVLIGSVVRPSFREFFRKSLDGLKQADPKLWLALVWMVKRRPSSYALFRSFLLGTATGGERLLDWFGKQAGILGQIVDAVGQQLLEDVDGNLTDYCNDQPDSVFAEYKGPSEIELREIGSKLNQHFKQWINQFVRRLPMLVDFRKDAIFGAPGWELAQTLLVQTEADYQKYFRWYASLGQDARTKNRYFHVMPSINNTGEFARFISMNMEDMTAYVNHTYETTRWRLIDTEMLAQGLDAYERFSYHVIGGAAADWMYKNAELAARREQAIRAERSDWWQHWALMPAGIATCIISGIMLSGNTRIYSLAGGILVMALPTLVSNINQLRTRMRARAR